MPCIPFHALECLLPQIVHHSTATIFQACQLALSDILLKLRQPEMTAEHAE
jgi:hypothetical protein